MINKENPQRTFAMVSLGCAKNQVDAESMSGLLLEAGFVSVGDPAQAETIIVNTCGFIQSAKEEAIDTIFDMVAHKKSGRCLSLIVTGCLSQRYGDEMLKDMPEADAFVGIGHISDIVGIVNRALSGERFVTEEKAYSFPKAGRAVSTSPRYAYLKVADGCDNRCAYCAIPGIRGGFISRPMDDILREAKELAQMGFDEIIPIAQDTTRYGLDIYGRPRLIDLLEGLSGISEVRWVRPMYFYPDMVSRELIDAMAATQKVCNYMDLPLQHIDDVILKNMRRRGSSHSIKEIISYARSRGEFALRTTFITGFPGESKEQFESLLAFIKEYPFDRLGAFAYSQEEGTLAAESAGQVSASLRKSRQNKIMAAQRAISASLLRERVGREYEVVLESLSPEGKFVGRSMLEAPEVDGSIFVSPKDGSALDIGQYVRVKITGAQDYDLTGVAL
ncbi:MAG: 30S ribosomal protein S12 methylthiotransferase RimO [Christensenellales bacterium]